jgi:hypothetical protein
MDLDSIKPSLDSIRCRHRVITNIFLDFFDTQWPRCGRLSTKLDVSTRYIREVTLFLEYVWFSGSPQSPELKEYKGFLDMDCIGYLWSTSGLQNNTLALQITYFLPGSYLVFVPNTWNVTVTARLLCDEGCLCDEESSRSLKYTI